jgi:hypothetical protein
MTTGLTTVLIYRHFLDSWHNAALHMGIAQPEIIGDARSNGVDFSFFPRLGFG